MREVNQPLDKLSVVVGEGENNSLRTTPVISDPSLFLAIGTVNTILLFPGKTSACQPNQISV